MVYINSSGELASQRSWFRLSIISDLFWSIINFFSLFFETLVKPPDEALKLRRGPDNVRGFGGSGYGGGGGGGGYPPRPGGRGAPQRRPGSNIKGMSEMRRQQRTSNLPMGAGG